MKSNVDVVTPLERSSMLVRLPSKGKPYKDVMSTGQVEVSAMRLSDEAVFRNLAAQGKYDEAVAALVRRCVTAPPQFMRETLLPIDEYLILLAIRTVTYGPEYKVTWTCPVCNHVNKNTINIMEDLKKKTIPDDVDPNNLVFTMPNSKITVKVRYLTIKDMDDIKEYSASLADTDKYKAELYTYAMQTVEFGNKRAGSATLPELMELWGNMPATDIRAFDKWFASVSPEIDTVIKKPCAAPSCKFVYEGEMPFTAEFFQPSDT